MFLQTTICFICKFEINTKKESLYFGHPCTSNKDIDRFPPGLCLYLFCEALMSVALMIVKDWNICCCFYSLFSIFCTSRTLLFVHVVLNKLTISCIDLSLWTVLWLSSPVALVCKYLLCCPFLFVYHTDAPKTNFFFVAVSRCGFKAALRLFICSGYVETSCFFTFQFLILCCDSAVVNVCLGTKKHLVRRSPCFGVKYPVRLLQTWLEMYQTLVFLLVTSYFRQFLW